MAEKRDRAWLYSTRDLIEVLIERGAVVEAWVTTRINDEEVKQANFDWRKMLDETNIQQLVNCQPFKENLRRKETVEDDSTLVTHTILIIRATEDTRDIAREPEGD